MSVEEDVMKIQKKLTKMTSDDGTVGLYNFYSLKLEETSSAEPIYLSTAAHGLMIMTNKYNSVPK
jgi:hypothetical protein